MQFVTGNKASLTGVLWAKFEKIAPSLLGAFMYLAFVAALGLVIVEIATRLEVTFMPGHGVAVGIAIGALLMAGWTSIARRFYDKHTGLFDDRVSNSWQVWLIATVVVATASLATMQLIATPDGSSFMEGAASLLGGMGALASVLGLFWAGYSIRQFRRQILSFDEFAARYQNLAREVKDENLTGDRLRVLAYTPIPGSLALSKERYVSLRDEIISDGARIELCCLEENEFENWFAGFEGKKARDGRVTKEQILNASEDIKTLVKGIKSPLRSEDKSFADQHPPKGFKKHELPSFYLFFTDKRALVTIPLFFPIETDSEGLKGRFSDRSVEMIGFETTDQGVISMLREYYEVYRQRASAGVIQQSAVQPQVPGGNPPATPPAPAPQT